jgi:acylphosphatase
MALHLRLTGTVQGVGFRQFLRAEGQRLGLSGWVANAPDGAVELAASGSADAEAALASAARRGPARARVASVQSLPADGIVKALPFPFTVRF